MNRLYADLAALKMQLALAKLALKSGFDPGQPRVPAGSPSGGQWTGGEATEAAFGRIYRPVGNGFIPNARPTYNPLDPMKLNRPLSAVEGQRISGALTAMIVVRPPCWIRRIRIHTRTCQTRRRGRFFLQAWTGTRLITLARGTRIDRLLSTMDRTKFIIPTITTRVSAW